MAIVATASINTTLKGSLSNNGLDIGQASFSFNESFNLALSNGVGINAITQMWNDIRTIAASTSDDINLNTLTNAFGLAASFASIKAMLVKANIANTNNLVVGNAATPFASFFGAADNTLILPPGAMVLLTNPSSAGYAVTPTTNHLLTITNGGAGTTVSYEIFLFGVAA